MIKGSSTYCHKTIHASSKFSWRLWRDLRSSAALRSAEVVLAFFELGVGFARVGIGEGSFEQRNEVQSSIEVGGAGAGVVEPTLKFRVVDELIIDPLQRSICEHPFLAHGKGGATRRAEEEHREG